MQRCMTPSRQPGVLVSLVSFNEVRVICFTFSECFAARVSKRTLLDVRFNMLKAITRPIYFKHGGRPADKQGSVWMVAKAPNWQLKEPLGAFAALALLVSCMRVHMYTYEHTAAERSRCWFHAVSSISSRWWFWAKTCSDEPRKAVKKKSAS